MKGRLFEDGLANILNKTADNVCIEVFTVTAMSMAGEPTSSEQSEHEHVELSESCVKVLDRVSYLPVKPADMKQELVKIGVRENLCETLSAIWSEYSKRIVTEKRKLPSELINVGFEVARDVVNQEQSVNLYLDDIFGNKTSINFTPDELLSFYNYLERLQTSVDSICK